MQLIKIEKTNARIEELKMVAKELNNVGVIAGGAVLDALLDQDYKDIDLFYTAQTDIFKRSFVNYAIETGSVFDSIGGGRYSETAFAESAPVSMFNKTFQVEIIEKSSANLIATIRNSIRRSSGDFDQTQNNYDVLPADQSFVQDAERELEQFNALGEYDKLLSVYGKLLIHEFDLDIKQIMIDPLTLDVLATPAFIKAFTNKTVDFSKILIFGEGVTRRNLVRILDASNKYNLRIENEAKIVPFIEAMRDFHLYFPVDTMDTTFIKRYTKNFRTPFLVTNQALRNCLDYEGIEHLLTSTPKGSIPMDPSMEFNDIATQMFDYWTRETFRNKGARIQINQFFGARRSSFSQHFSFLIRHLDEMKETKLGEFLYTLLQADNLFNSEDRVVKWVAAPFEELGLMQELKCDPSREISMNGYAPCHDIFLEYLQHHTLEETTKWIASTLLTTSEYVAYTVKSVKLSSRYRLDPFSAGSASRDDLSYVYSFSSDIKRKVDMFDLFDDYLSFPSLEAFETVRYYSLAQNRNMDFRTILDDSKLVRYVPDVVNIEEIVRNMPEHEIAEDDMPW